MAQMNPQQMHMMQMQQQQQQQQQQMMLQQQQQQQMMMQQQQQQQQAQQQQQQQQQTRQSQEDKLVSKARELINGPLKEKWNSTIKEASQRLYANGVLDNGGQLPSGTTVNQGTKFESNLEDFYATLDQIEVVLRCAIESQQQAQSSNRYMQIPPQPNRLENMQNPEEYLSYPQYISIAKQQVQYADNIRQMILQATTDVVEQRHGVPQQNQQAQQQPQQTPATQQQGQQQGQPQQLPPSSQGQPTMGQNQPQQVAVNPMNQGPNTMPMSQSQPTLAMGQSTNMPMNQPMSQGNMNPIMNQNQMNFN